MVMATAGVILITVMVGATHIMAMAGVILTMDILIMAVVVAIIPAMSTHTIMVVETTLPALMAQVVVQEEGDHLAMPTPPNLPKEAEIWLLQQAAGIPMSLIARPTVVISPAPIKQPQAVRVVQHKPPDEIMGPALLR